MKKPQKKQRKERDPYKDLVITFRPDATPEEEDEFLTELAYAILAVARHTVNKEIEAQGGEAIPEGELNLYVNHYIPPYKKAEASKNSEL